MNSLENEKLQKEDLEYVTSVSEARLLAAPKGASLLIFLTACLLLGLISWSLIMSVDEVVKGQGKVIPSKQIQNIQSLDGGVIKNIYVMEGQHVKKDTLLIEIDDIEAKSDFAESKQDYHTLLAHLETIDAILANKRKVTFSDELKDYQDHKKIALGRFNAFWDEYTANTKQLKNAMKQRKKESDAAKSTLQSAKQDYDLAKEELALNKNAYDRGVIAQITYLQSKHNTNERKAKYQQAKHDVPKTNAAYQEAVQKLETYKTERMSQVHKEREQVSEKLALMKAKETSLEAKVEYSTIESPVEGIVKKINFNTIGGVIRPGEMIMEIVPTDDKLLIEAKVNPKDIGFVQIDLEAVVKLTAYDFSTYGGLNGKVRFVSADAITDEKGKSFFIIRILTDKNYIVDKKGKKHTIIPGMQSEVDIVVDQKSVLTYILKPLLK